jgi:hypothetical protein
MYVLQTARLGELLMAGDEKLQGVLRSVLQDELAELRVWILQDIQRELKNLMQSIGVEFGLPEDSSSSTAKPQIADRSRLTARIQSHSSTHLKTKEAHDSMSPDQSRLSSSISGTATPQGKQTPLGGKQTPEKLQLSPSTALFQHSATVGHQPEKPGRRVVATLDDADDLESEPACLRSQQDCLELRQRIIRQLSKAKLQDVEEHGASTLSSPSEDSGVDTAIPMQACKSEPSLHRMNTLTFRFPRPKNEKHTCIKDRSSREAAQSPGRRDMEAVGIAVTAAIGATQQKELLLESPVASTTMEEDISF